uniref:transposase n=1 Tax=Helicobacter labacensis TaxID=2316079 RepID=UPI001F4160FD
ISAFNTLLEYKAKYYGREVKRVDAFYPSSKTCSSCGHIKTTLFLNPWKFAAKAMLRLRRQNKCVIF